MNRLQFLSLLSLLFVVSAQQNSHCIYTAKNGFKFDASLLTNKGSAGGDIPITNGFYGPVQWYFNPCGVTNYYKSGSSPKSECGSASICGVNGDGLGDINNTVWDQETTSLVQSSSFTNVSSSQGCENNARFSKIAWICDPTAKTPQMMSVTSVNCGIYFQLVLDCETLFPQYPNVDSNDGCNLIDKFGNFFNLSKITDKGPSGGDFLATTKDYSFYYNPCGVTNFYRASPQSRSKCSGASSCQSGSSGVYALGDRVGATWVQSSGQNSNKIRSSATSECPNSVRQSSVTYVCDPEASTPRLAFVNEGPICTYNFQFRLNCSVFSDRFYPASYCLYRDPKGEKYDLSWLTDKGPSGGDFSATAGTATYYFNPCGITNYYKSNPQSRSACASSTVCQDSKGSYSLGERSSMTWSNVSDYAVANISSSDSSCLSKPRTTQIRIACDSGVKSPKLVFNGESPTCNYNLDLQVDCDVLNAPRPFVVETVAPTTSVPTQTVVTNPPASSNPSTTIAPTVKPFISGVTFSKEGHFLSINGSNFGSLADAVVFLNGTALSNSLTFAQTSYRVALSAPLYRDFYYDVQVRVGGQMSNTFTFVVELSDYVRVGPGNVNASISSLDAMIPNRDPNWKVTGICTYAGELIDQLRLVFVHNNGSKMYSTPKIGWQDGGDGCTETAIPTTGLKSVDTWYSTHPYYGVPASFCGLRLNYVDGSSYGKYFGCSGTDARYVVGPFSYQANPESRIVGLIGEFLSSGKVGFYTTAAPTLLSIVTQVPTSVPSISLPQTTSDSVNPSQTLSLPDTTVPVVTIPSYSQIGTRSVLTVKGVISEIEAQAYLAEGLEVNPERIHINEVTSKDQKKREMVTVIDFFILEEDEESTTNVTSSQLMDKLKDIIQNHPEKLKFEVVALEVPTTTVGSSAGTESLNSVSFGSTKDNQISKAHSLVYAVWILFASVLIVLN